MTTEREKAIELAKEYKEWCEKEPARKEYDEYKMATALLAEVAARDKFEQGYADANIEIVEQLSDLNAMRERAERAEAKYIEVVDKYNAAADKVIEYQALKKENEALKAECERLKDMLDPERMRNRD